MLATRIIPVLLLDGKGLVKTRKFKDPKYVGDPINAVRIFNDKEVDELVFLDISATRQEREPDFQLIREIATEAFMPFAYGGGVRTMGQIERLFRLGVEKVVLNTAAYKPATLIRQASESFGAQSIVGSVDVRRDLFGRQRLVSHGGKKKERLGLVDHVRWLEQEGIGEILLNSVDHDGMMQGYDLELIQKVSEAVSVPVVACGGAGSLEHMKRAVEEAKADAAAAGSLFVFNGRHRAVLINYPTRPVLKQYFRGDD